MNDQPIPKKMFDRDRVADEDLTEIEEVFRRQGLSLEDVIESGRELRSDLLRELYGIDDK